MKNLKKKGYGIDRTRKRLQQVKDMVKVLGHRGCAGIEPENTIRAFKRAIDLCVDLKIVTKEGVSSKVIIVSFWHNVLKRIKEIEPEIKTGAIFVGRPVDTVSIAKAAKSELLCLKHKFIDEEVVVECHKNDIEVNAWVVNDIEDIVKMKELGVDIISSDHPDRVLEELKS